MLPQMKPPQKIQMICVERCAQNCFAKLRMQKRMENGEADKERSFRKLQRSVLKIVGFGVEVLA